MLRDTERDTDLELETAAYPQDASSVPLSLSASSLALDGIPISDHALKINHQLTARGKAEVRHESSRSLSSQATSARKGTH